MARGASTRTDSVDDRCRAIVHELRGRLDELVAAAWEPLAATIPTWSTLATTNRAEGLRTGVRWTVEACLRALGSGREPTVDERETMRSLGAAQADLGVERAQLAEGVRAAVTRGYEQVVAQSRSAPDGAAEVDIAALGELSRRLLTFAGVLSEEMTRGWDGQHSERRGARHREREAAVARLLEGRTGPGAGPDDDLHGLGVDARQPCGLLVVARASPVVDDADDLEGEARALAAALPGCVVGCARRRPRPHRVLVVPGAPEGRWRDLLAALDVPARSEGLTVLATRAPNRAALAEAYAGARWCLPAGGDLSEHLGVVEPERLAVDALLASVPEPARDAYLHTTLGGLRDLDDPRRAHDLIETLTAYLETRRSARAAAGRVHVHEQTVHQRLDAIRRATGFSPRHPADALALHLALRPPAARRRSPPRHPSSRRSVTAARGAR